MIRLSLLFIYFITYSFLGWLIEVIGFSIKDKKWVNRGFLIGPYCPVYGLASVIMILLLYNYRDDPIILFILAVIIATIVEYLVSYILEKLFKIRWWDYSGRSFNLNGRIYLLYSLLFGVMGLLLLYVINPWYTDILKNIPEWLLNTSAGILFIIMVIDLIITTNILFKIRDNVTLVMKDRSEEIGLLVKRKVGKQVKRINHIRQAFPGLKPIAKDNIIKQVKDFLNK